jgi:alpha-tubulin suppressor-like RCC1 family protein
VKHCFETSWKYYWKKGDFNWHEGFNTFIKLKDVEEVICARAHIVVKKTDGTIVTWGDNSYGQLNVPKDLGDVKSIKCGLTNTVVLKTDGSVVVFGNKLLAFNSDGSYIDCKNNNKHLCLIM